jgi:hypothetical protein
MRDKELKKRLRALREPAPPSELGARLERGIPDTVRQPESTGRPWRVWTMPKLAAVAAGTLATTITLWLVTGFILGLFGPPVVANVLAPVAAATDRIQAVHVVLRMLTREGEDFSYVNLGGEPERVEAWIEWPQGPGEPGRARMDKTDRIYNFDGTGTVFYHPKRNEAFQGRGRGIDHDLFWPAAWVRYLRSIPTGEVEVVEHYESGGKGSLVLRQKGAPVDGLDPSFLGDFDREIEVEWNTDTHLLTGLRRWVYHEGQRVLFSELESIDYLESVDDEIFRLDLPGDVRWGGVKDAPIEVLALGPREVAIRFFEAAKSGDRETLELYCGSPSMVDWLLEEAHRPTELLFLGEPFRGGNYPGVYVPYRVRFGKEGRVKEYNLALRNDNHQRRWVYDGGI